MIRDFAMQGTDDREEVRALEQAVHYGHTLETPPNCMPSGWAALLYLFNLR